MELLNGLSLLAQAEAPEATAGALIGILIYLAVAVVALIGGWKMYAKAGEPGWGIIVPIFNLYLLHKIAGRPAWWLLLYIVPPVGFIIWILVNIDVAKAFGRGAGTGLGLSFLSIIFYPILGFGSAQYQRTA